MCSKDEMFNSQELQEEADLQDQLDSEYAHQQALDEESDLKAYHEEPKELADWFLGNEMLLYASNYGESELGKFIRSRFPGMVNFL